MNHILETNPNAPTQTLARLLGLSLPKELFPRGVGASRKKELVFDRVLSECKSWLERFKVVLGESSKFVSQGWDRTATVNKPSNLTPKVNLAVVNGQFAEFVDSPLNGRGFFTLGVVIKGKWEYLVFEFDPERFNDASRFSKPIVRIDDSGGLVFDFCAVYEYDFGLISERYIVGVDVGLHSYVTLVVWDCIENRIVFENTLSQRVHSLWNSVRASEVEKKALLKKGFPELARLHREAASRKKRELAILAGQEIAGVAHDWDNAVVGFEDLSWVRNTMANGRWNRGALVEWVTHYVELNGSRVFKVNASGTSQYCSRCGVMGYCDKKRLFHCLNDQCGLVLDRDVNAAGNVAARFGESLKKVVLSRSKSKRFTGRKSGRRSPIVRNSLKFPGRDRSKTGPTAKRPKKVKNRVLGEVFSKPSGSTSEIVSTVLVGDTESKSVVATIKQPSNYWKKRYSRLLQ